MDKLRRDTLLGIVFFGTLGFLLWATISLTDLSLQERLDVWFDDAGGAQVGTNVMVLGKKVGKVSEMDFVPDEPQRIRMVLVLSERLNLKRDARIEVQDANALGGKQVYVDPGLQREPWPSGTRLVGIARPGALDRVGNIADAQGPIGERLEELLLEARNFFRNMNDADTSIGALVRRREMYDEVLQTVQSLRSIFRSIEDGEGILGRVVKDRTLREDAMRLVANLAEVSQALRGTDGTVGMFLNDREFAGNLRQTVADVSVLVADAREGKGPLGRLLRDEQLANDLTEAVTNIAAFMRKANDPQSGLFGALSSDPTIASDLRLTIANLRQVTDELNGTKGVLGILINDEDLGLRLRRIFTQVTRALEDAREAAPIGSFVQVLFGVF